MGYDGWLRIGTELDSKSLENQIKSIEKELNKLKSDNEKLSNKKDKIENDLTSYEEEKRIIQELTDESLKYAQTRNEIEAHLANENAMLSDLDSKYSKQKEKLTDINNEIETNKLRQQELNAEISEMNTELKKVKGYENIKSFIDDVKEETGKTIKTIGKWALAVFGVRAAYNFVRQSVSTLAQYNEQLAADLEYIQFATASALQPIIEQIISLTYKLLQYINYIAKAWFGVNLFANATAAAMNKTANSAKEVKKSLTGFDEMNTLGASNLSDTVLNGIPSMDLSNGLGNGKIPEWIKWIAENKDLIINALLGIAGGITSLKLSELAKNLGLVNKQLGIMKGLGIGLIILSLITLIQDLIDYFKKLDSSLEENGTKFTDFGKIVTVIGTLVAGLGMVFLGLPVTIAGAIIAVVGIITKYWKEIECFFNKKVFGWFDEKIESLRKKGLIGKLLAEVLVEIKRIVKDGTDAFGTMLGGFKQIFDGIVLFVKGDFKNGLTTALKGIINTIIGNLNTLINGINSMLGPLRSIIVSMGQVTGKKWSMDNIKIPKIPMLAVGGIINLPGKGVPIASAYGGESGREGVIPLTDSQAMEELGSAIGRYITINLTNNTNLDGRTILRQQSKVQVARNFAMNR